MEVTLCNGQVIKWELFDVKSNDASFLLIDLITMLFPRNLDQSLAFNQMCEELKAKGEVAKCF